MNLIEVIKIKILINKTIGRRTSIENMPTSNDSNRFAYTSTFYRQELFFEPLGTKKQSAAFSKCC